jgi:hypothetical protein
MQRKTNTRYSSSAGAHHDSAALGSVSADFWRRRCYIPRVRQGYTRRGWAAVVIALIAVGAGVAATGKGQLGPILVLLASISFIAGLVIFARGKGYPALTIVAIIVLPALLTSFLPMRDASGVGGLLTIVLIALLPDKVPKT